MLNIYLFFELSKIIVDNIGEWHYYKTYKIKDTEKMNQSIFRNFILVLNLIGLVIIGGVNKACCGCAGKVR